MANTFTVRSVAVVRSTYYLKGGNSLVPSDGSLYEPLRVDLLDSASFPVLLDSQTRAELIDSSTRVVLRT